MDHGDHVALLRGGVPAPGGVWADLGAGAGAFTLALAELLGPGGEIHAVDRDGRALRQLAEAMRSRFPATVLHTFTADFTRPLDLPPLDGVVLANALHFVREREATVRLVRDLLRPGGRLLLVEYDTDRGNRWVPYPLAYEGWAALARRAGFAETRRLASRPSRFLGAIYAAVSR
jgi:SAM-dependent methyltransferase